MKSLVYWLTICAILGIQTLFWMTSSFEGLSPSEKLSMMPFAWAIVLFAAIFEPLLFVNGAFERRVRAQSYVNLVVRGFLSGVAIFAVWVGLFMLHSGCEIPVLLLVVIGYGVACAVTILGVFLGSRNPATERIDRPQIPQQ